MSSSDGKPRRLHWGSGGYPAEGWVSSDARDYPSVDIVCDIRDGLPLDSDSFDYAASIHALPEIPYPDLLPTLVELRRVLKPGGVLRLGLPDLDKSIRAYLDNDTDYWLIPDEDAQSPGAKLVLQTIWYGFSRSLFTRDFIEELLLKAGFSRVDQCDFQQTSSSFAEIVELDNRELESLYVEAVK